MKTFKIAHLYYDLMNLYGENGNIRYFSKKLEEQGIKTEVYFFSIDDDIDYNDYDFFYIGTGSENNKKMVLEHLISKKEKIKKAIEAEKYFLVTGNAIELFGENIITLSSEAIETLGTFKYQVKEEEFRIVGEQFYSTELFDKKIIGFQNRSSIIINCKEKNLFNVIKGTGYSPENLQEGIQYKNFFATYLLGPLLVRNPYFTDYIVEKICNTLEVEFISNVENISYKAYQEYLKNFHSESL